MEEEYKHVVIDVETTGLVAGTHDLIEIAIVEYNPDTFKPTGLRFVSYLKPERPHLALPKAMEVNKLDLKNLQVSAPKAAQVRMMLLTWKEELFGNAKLFVLGHNYCFDHSFIKIWLGDLYENIFHHRYKDTQIIAQYLLDKSGLKKSTGLKSLCEFYKIEYKDSHTAYGDCLLTLQVYQKQVGR
jgi:DNA polymerase III epsilon subunit-like protein